MDYFKKIEENTYKDLAWNIPETKKGMVNVIGGNKQNFRAVIKTAEYLSANLPIQTIRIVMPDSLKSQLPDLPNLMFLNSTESGSFAEDDRLLEIMGVGDYNLVIGDWSKNAVTAKVLADALEKVEIPTMITRDSVDLMTEEKVDRILMNDGIVYFASLAQLQKVLRAVYYPKMLLMTQSLMQVAEVLHKFTLSYPAKIITLHSGQVLIAENGKVFAMPFEKTRQTMLTFWNGELAGKLVVYNLYNPDQFIEASVAGLFK